MKNHRWAGFTLLEMIVAIAIFATLTMMAYQVLQGVLRNGDITREKAQQLMELQFAQAMFEQDFSQAVIRQASTVNDNVDFNAPSPLTEEQSDQVLLVRGNWFNPDDLLPRSHLQRCGYLLTDDGTLLRVNYRQLDDLDAYHLRSRVLLKGVTQFQLRFLHNGRWQRGWVSDKQLPDAVAVTLQLDKFGSMQKVVMLTNGQIRSTNKNSANSRNSQ